MRTRSIETLGQLTDLVYIVIGETGLEQEKKLTSDNTAKNI